MDIAFNPYVPREIKITVNAVPLNGAGIVVGLNNV
jgi:hypothetical protein